MSLQDTYHVTLGKRRTTVSVDKIISVVMALKLGVEPGTKEAHSAVRTVLQDKLDEDAWPARDDVSQWLREKLLFEVMDKKLSKLYWDWFEPTKWKRIVGGRPRRR